jgi:cytochrome c-type biogenesis protein
MSHQDATRMLHRSWVSAAVPGAVWLLLVLAAAMLALGWLAIARTQGRDTLLTTARLRSTQTAELTASLTRSGAAGEGVQADVVLATPTFFQLTNRSPEVTALGADRAVVFVANESVHYGSLSPRFAPILRLDGDSLHVPSEVRVLTDAVHHRTSVVVFGDLPPLTLERPHTFTLLLPQDGAATRTALEWQTPIEYPASVQGPSGLSLGLLLSLAAGLLAAISPCLLQLTAFYLPTLAGVSADASITGLSEGQRRRRVLGTAVRFILGFSIPYTAGGALMGGMGQVLAGSQLLSPTGPIAVGAGAVMILMAGVVAHRARAPLVCQLPLPGSIQHSARLGVLGPFVSGFAIATGCLACFGGAILGVLLVYAGLLGSPLLGALAMLLFSLGLAVPFMLAALGLSWTLPLALRLQRATPAIGLASAGAMLFFGLSMASGNFHLVSGWLHEHLPLA